MTPPTFGSGGGSGRMECVFIKWGLLGAVNFEAGPGQRVHTAVAKEADAREGAWARESR